MTKISRVEGPTWAALLICYAAYAVLTVYCGRVAAYLPGARHRHCVFPFAST